MAFLHSWAKIDRLYAAWEKVRRNRGGPGGDGVTVADFSAKIDLRLNRLALELQHGLYRPGPLRRLQIPKKSGGVRVLSIPSVVDRVAQTAAATALSEFLEPEFEEASFGYRPGRSVAQAVRRVDMLRRSGYHWVVDADIEQFFDTVPHRRLLEKLGGQVGDEHFVDLVSLWLETFGEDGIGLAQGSPISPVLANLFLDALDEEMEQDGIRIVRFADDFLLLARNETKARGALERAIRHLAGEGLKLNAEKTRIVSFEEAFHFLGKLFVRAMMIDAEASDEPARVDVTAAEAPAVDLNRSKVAAATREPIVEEGGAGQVSLSDEETIATSSQLGPRQRTLYVCEPKRMLTAAGEAFSVEEEGAGIIAIPARLVHRVEVGPAARIAEKALRLASDWGVPVFLVDGYGRQQSVLSPSMSSDPELVLAQAGASGDDERRLALVQAIVSGRLANAQALLKRLNRRRKSGAVEEACDQLLALRRRAAVARDVDQARGFEGSGAARYWPALSMCLSHGWKIPLRRRHPAPDPVNIVLDWMAALLTRDMSVAVLAAGLHPGIGTLHATARGREACVFDLVEEFRAPIAEAATVSLFNKRILTRDDFVSDDVIRIARGSGNKVIRAYETWLARVVLDPADGQRTTWRGLLMAQARAYAASVRAGNAYIPYKLDF